MNKGYIKYTQEFDGNHPDVSRNY